MAIQKTSIALLKVAVARDSVESVGNTCTLKAISLRYNPKIRREIRQKIVLCMG